MPRSEQQQAAINWYRTGRGNAFITAVAGAGKTTTLIDIVEAATENPRNSIAYAAFNKAIADEVKAKLEARGLLTSRVRVGTFHSFGWTAWKRAHPDCRLDGDLPFAERKWTIIQAQLATKLSNIDEVSLAAATTQVEKLMPSVKKLVSFAKAAAMQPDDFANVSMWRTLSDHYGLEDDLEDPSQIGRVINMARVAIAKSIQSAHISCDFDDMLYMPVISGTKIWQNDLLLVDEAQDTNPIRMALSRMMVNPRYGRSIFVGDPNQAIYGFSGADAAAVEAIRRDFNCADIPLTVTFRCPKAVVRAANAYVSHIVAADTAPEGEVKTVQLDVFMKTLGFVQKTDAILCRKTAPLIQLAYTLLNKGIGCKVEGKDIGLGLKGLLKKWKVEEVPAFLERLDDWAEAKFAKYRAKGEDMRAEQLADQIAALKLLATGCALKSEVETKIDGLFGDNVKGVITLATVHRSKGREWPTVYLLGANRWMPLQAATKDWEVQQEFNLIYVALTRAQEKFVHIDMPWED